MSLIDKRMFYVRPTNSILLEDSNKVDRVSIDDIKGLAMFALTLRDYIEVNDPSVYLNALAEFFANNQNEYSYAYKKISVSHFGMNFLCTNIKMVILEGMFRQVGIDEHLAEVYNNELTEYNGQLELNDAMFVAQVKSDDEYAYARVVCNKMAI